MKLSKESSTHSGIYEGDEDFVCANGDVLFEAGETFEIDLGNKGAAISLQDHIALNAFSGPVKMEIRCKVPKIKGAWSAFWTWAQNEIDIFDFFGNEHGHSQYFENNYHAGGGCSFKYQESNGVDFGDGYHTFAVEFSWYYIKYILDGRVIRTVTRFETEHGELVGSNCGDEINAENLVENRTFPIALGSKYWRPQMSLNITYGLDDPKALAELDGNLPVYYDIQYVRLYKKNSASGDDWNCNAIIEEVDESENCELCKTFRIRGNYNSPITDVAWEIPSSMSIEYLDGEKITVCKSNVLDGRKVAYQISADVEFCGCDDLNLLHNFKLDNKLVHGLVQGNINGHFTVNQPLQDYYNYVSDRYFTVAFDMSGNKLNPTDIVVVNNESGALIEYNEYSQELVVSGLGENQFIMLSLIFNNGDGVCAPPFEKIYVFQHGRKFDFRNKELSFYATPNPSVNSLRIIALSNDQSLSAFSQGYSYRIVGLDNMLRSPVKNLAFNNYASNAIQLHSILPGIYEILVYDDHVLIGNTRFVKQ